MSTPPLTRRPLSDSLSRFLIVVACAMAALSLPANGAEDANSNEGADLAIGGPGSGPGQFLELRDITFDPAGNLYALDGLRLDPKTRQPEGNLRVQKFSRDGKLLAMIDVRDLASGAAPEPQGDTLGPQRLAADGAGNVYVTEPGLGKVWQFSADRKLARTYDVPHAMAITVWKTDGGRGPERVAVVPSRREVVPNKGWAWVGGDRIEVLNPAGGLEKSIPLGRALENVQDLASDRAGSFYVKAEPNAVYVFSPEGKLLKTLGGNPTSRAEDGSELLHTVAVDSKGNIYSMTWGNPGLVTRFDADGRTVTQRGGQFKWADPWSVHSGYTVLAIDPDDRLWVAVTHRQDPAGVNFKKYHPVPAIVRARPDFFEKPAGSVKVTPVRMLGFKSAVTCGLSNNVSYEAGKAVPMTFTVLAANRNVTAATVKWHVYDAVKNEAAAGQFELPLENGKEAAVPFAFTPPRFGAYFVLAEVTSPQGPLGGVGEHVGVTPRFAGLPELPEEKSKSLSKGGWIDPTRQVWSGLPSLRIHPAKDEKGLAQTDEQVAAAEKAGVTFILQLVDNMKDLTPEHVRRVVTRYKGRVKYYEVCNEPNFSSKPDDYFKGHKMAYTIIKEVDPSAAVMGPATVNVNLAWLRRLYELGFKDVTDIVSTHDYEGHESVTPEHWVWKFGQYRQIMADHGDGAKPVWQTERAIAGVRGNDFQGLVQAIRCTLHRDLLATLGIPSAHNFHYYLNQAGYGAVPSYLWSENGPHPAALALRTRYALTEAAGRTYAGKLDFGPTGNTLLMGVRYAAADGQTIILRNLGSRPMPVEFEVKGTGANATPTSVDVTDAWGNVEKVAVRAGKVRLALAQLPSYVRLGPGQELVPRRIDFGANVAPRAKWGYTAGVEKGDFSLLTNGVYETYHDGDPNGDTNGAKIWTGDLPAADKAADPPPQTLTATFDSPQTIDKVIIRGVRADNTFCALLDYDLEYLDGAEWKAIEKVRNAMPPSEDARTADATAAIWMDDTNFYIHAFPPVKAKAVRLRVLRVSHGFVPDTRATAWGNSIPCKLMLREIEIFSPAEGAR